MRAGELASLSQFDVFFNGVELLVVEVDAAVIERATDLRARYQLKTPDAIHYASAMVAGATVFLIGDRGLSRCTEVAVEIL
jgi:predicted nucleic acid-binding protein